MTYTNWLINKDNDTVLKTRDLDLYSFFTRLQEEYICAELRKKIYIKIKDKRFYERVMQGKKEKIKDISFRNALPNIFTSEKLKEKIYKSIYNGIGYPDFIYCNDEERYIIEQLDLKNYYCIGACFKVFIDDDIFIGNLEIIDLKNSMATIIVNGISSEFNIDLITRIL